MVLKLGARQKGLQVDLNIGPEAYVDSIGDPAKIRQILLNLCGNAIKFTHSGSVTIDVELNYQDRQPTSVTIKIQDTGIGIAPDALGKLFSAFTQADSTMSRKFGGSGLGLVISKRLAETMGGDISVTSSVDCGSTFTATLPLVQVDSTQTALLPSDQSLISLILIQPEAENRGLYRFLMSSGIKVTTPKSLDELRRNLCELADQSSNRVVVAFIQPLPDMCDTQIIHFLKDHAGKMDLIASDKAFPRSLKQEMGQLSPRAILSEPVRPSHFVDLLLQSSDQDRSKSHGSVAVKKPTRSTFFLPKTIRSTSRSRLHHSSTSDTR